MGVFNLQKRLHEGAVLIEKTFFTEEERKSMPNYMVTIGHFNREHGHHLSSWKFEDGTDFAEIYIDAQAINRGLVYIWSILHHELVMLLLKGKGTGSFDSRTKAFSDLAIAKGLAVFPTKDRFKFRSAKKLEEHTDEWLDFIRGQVDHSLSVALNSLKSVVYPDLVSSRMVEAFAKSLEADSFYPRPEELLKPGTGGRAKRDYKLIKVKVTKDTEEEDVVDEAKNQYQTIHSKLIDED